MYSTCSSQGDPSSSGVRALVLVPSKELAKQAHRNLKACVLWTLLKWYHCEWCDFWKVLCHLGQGKKRKQKILFLEYFVASIYERKPTQICKFSARWKQKAHSKSCYKYKAINDQCKMQICNGHLCYSKIEEFLVITNCNNNEKKNNKMFQKESLSSSFADQLHGIVAPPLVQV